MGYETYLMEIRLKNNSNKKAFIDTLKENQFLLKESDGVQYLEKSYNDGIVEIHATNKLITFRYAKPNLTSSLFQFLKELQIISLKYELDLYDVRYKKLYKPECFDDIIEEFDRCRAEFQKHYPDIGYPVKSNEVFKTIK